MENVANIREVPSLFYLHTGTPGQLCIVKRNCPSWNVDIATSEDNIAGNNMPHLTNNLKHDWVIHVFVHVVDKFIPSGFQEFIYIKRRLGEF